MKELIQSELVGKKHLRVNFVLEGEFKKVDLETMACRFFTLPFTISATSDLDVILTDAFEKMIFEMQDKIIEKSGWSLSALGSIHVLSNKYNQIRIGSYLELPPKIKLKRATINPINKYDENCFEYALTAGYKYQLRERQRDAVTEAGRAENFNERLSYNLNSVPYLRRFDFGFDYTNITFPTPVKQMKEFMKNNPDISINLFSLDDDQEVYPVEIYEGPARQKHFNLLIIQHEEITHFVYITNLARLVHGQTTSDHSKIHICNRCLTAFRTEEKLELHKPHCLEHKIGTILMPEEINGEKPVIKFEKHNAQLANDFYVVADFESVLKDIHTCNNHPEVSSSIKYQHHQPFSYGLKLITDLPPEYTSDLNLETEIYRGENVADHFIDRITDIANMVSDKYKKENIAPMIINKNQIKEHRLAKKCYICSKNFEKYDYSKKVNENCKVRDHHHITGQYRGAAHSKCNLLARRPRSLRVFFHNMKYDIKFVVQGLKEKANMRDINVIANTEEDFITLSFKVGSYFKVEFIDSFRFLPASLENLAKNLSREDFLHVANEFTDPVQQDLAVRKSVFCYDYLNDLTKLNDTQLPPKEVFFNRLSNEHISDADYAHAQTVWREFNIQNLGDYSDLYLKIDVPILADVFQRFRKKSMQTYGLDPTHFLTLPGLAWEAALKLTKISLELLTDYTMLLMVEKGIRGGISQCILRYAEAKNEFTLSKEEFSKLSLDEICYLLYLDANNLYGLSMSESLPTGGFKFVEDFGDPQKILNLKSNDSIGYIFEVDVEYPENLHDSHNDLPFLPETKLPPSGKFQKLLTTLDDKKKYVVHYTALKLAMEAGLIVKHIYRTIQFNQSPWLKAYIELNTKLRKEAKNAFDKDFFKLMNNSVYGKTMESLRKRITLKLLSRDILVRRYISSPLFKRRTIISENLMAVHLHRSKIYMNKPVYVGMAILDISKTWMYDFFHNKLRVWWPTLRLTYMDTDLYIILVKSPNVYIDMQKYKQEFDFSEYPQQGFYDLYSEDNKKVLGKFKDELNGKILTHFIGLKAKMYALKFDGQESKRVKGVKKNFVKQYINFEHFESCLFHDEKKYATFNAIRSYNQELYTERQTKVALTSNDDKRYILANGIDTLAHGHYRIVNHRDAE